MFAIWQYPTDAWPLQAVQDQGPYLVPTAGPGERLAELQDGTRLAVRGDQLQTIDADTLAAMVRGWITAALWADGVPMGMDDDGETGGLEHLSPDDALTDAATWTCAQFYATNREDVDVHLEHLDDPDGGHPAEYVGHTLYLTSVGHGVSFRDRVDSSTAPALFQALERLDTAAKYGPAEHWMIFQTDDTTATVDGVGPRTFPAVTA